MADLTCIIVARGNFNDVETSILIPFQQIFYDEDIGDIWKDSKKSIYGENMWIPLANSNNKKSIRVNFRIFSLSFLSDKVIKAIICCDRHSLAKFFQFFTDVSVDCD